MDLQQGRGFALITDSPTTDQTISDFLYSHKF